MQPKRIFILFVILIFANPIRADEQLKQDAKDVFTGTKNFVKHLFKKTTKKIKKTVDKLDHDDGDSGKSESNGDSAVKPKGS
jgi:hypothetical protein